MILVTGVSSSGKTHTLTALVQVAPWLKHVRASSVLVSIRRPLLDLPIATALANQHALSTELAKRGVRDDKDALLDGHATIETTAGTLLLPDEIFDALAPAAIVHVEADPAVILQRDAARSQVRTWRQVVDGQAAERSHAKSQAYRLKIPYLGLASGDVTVLLAFIAALDRAGLAGAHR